MFTKNTMKRILHFALIGFLNVSAAVCLSGPDFSNSGFELSDPMFQKPHQTIEAELAGAEFNGGLHID